MKPFPEVMNCCLCLADISLKKLTQRTTLPLQPNRVKPLVEILNANIADCRELQNHKVHANTNCERC